MRMENKQTDAVLRLASVRRETGSLQRKLNESRLAVQNARAQVNNTAHTARNLNKVCICDPIMAATSYHQISYHSSHTQGFLRLSAYFYVYCSKHKP